MNEILWQPTPERAAATQIVALAREQGFDGPGAVDTSWRWPAENPGPF